MTDAEEAFTSALFPTPFKNRVALHIRSGQSRHGGPATWVVQPSIKSGMIGHKRISALHNENFDMSCRIDPTMAIVELLLKRQVPVESGSEDPPWMQFSYMQPDGHGAEGYSGTEDVMKAVVAHFETHSCGGQFQLLAAVGDRLQFAGPFLTNDVPVRAQAELPVAVVHAATRALLTLPPVLNRIGACCFAACHFGEAVPMLSGTTPQIFGVRGHSARTLRAIIEAAPDIGSFFAVATPHFTDMFEMAGLMNESELQRLSSFVPEWMANSGAWTAYDAPPWRLRQGRLIRLRLLDTSIVSDGDRGEETPLPNED